MNQGTSIKGGGFRVSYMGAFCTILFVAISSFYLYTRIDHLIDVNNDDDDERAAIPLTMSSNVMESALTSNEVFSADRGLFIAAAVAEYRNPQNNLNFLEDPEIGQLNFGH